MRRNRKDFHVAAAGHGKSVNQLRDLLIKLGWSQSQLATRIDVTPRTVSLWMTGKTKTIPHIVILHLELLAALREVSR